jgi:pimeloyl-ACP methyl ester carboxylesterase
MTDIELFAGLTITIPCLFIGGKKDWGTYQEPGAIETMAEICTQFKGAELLEGAGHWVQQEQPERVVELVLGFLWDD